MIYHSAAQLAELIKAKEISSRDLVEAYLSRIDALNPKLHAIVAQNRELTRKEAILADESALPASELAPLHGVPVTVKESFNMQGFKTTVNYPPLKNFEPDEDSLIVKRLRDAGAIILGKTNVPLLLADCQTFGPLYPTCNNPYDITRVPGGSTGGGACAVASGMTTFEIGSDIGGSIRNPAHYCGLFGLKPTQNGHVQDGHIPPLPGTGNGYLDMNSTGPLARTMRDIELAYKLVYSPRWDYQRYLPVARDHARHSSLAGYRVAWFDEIHGIGCSNDTRKVLSAMCDTLSAKGAKVEKISIDKKLSEQMYKCWVKLFGFVVGQDFKWPLRKAMQLKFAHDLNGSRIKAKKELKQGLSLKFKHFSRALREQQELIAEFEHYFERFDFLISPTSVGPAFKHNPKHRPIEVDGEHMHYSDYAFAFVMPYNVMRHPVLTVPAGQSSEGLPIGLSIAAPHHTEEALIHFGHLLEAEGFGFKAPEIS
ncbi:MAG: amidase [Oleiphilaceae bacterium]|nr:amidase [Oleiphilaceae bacterium]